jgi:hypothetical protein
MSYSGRLRDLPVNRRCIHVRRRATGSWGYYLRCMGLARILGIAVALAAVATLCLLSTTTATIVGVSTLIAVGIDGLLRQPRRRDAHEHAVLIDLSTRDYVEGIQR